MIHGGVGYIKNGVIYTPYELLKPLSVVNNTRLFGVYYPSKITDNTSIRHDFVFSPIPHRYWPCIGRYIIRIKHDSEAIKNISGFLASQNISILISDAIRSGHRYDTWNLTVAFENENNLSDNTAYEILKKQILNRISKTKKLIEDNYSQDLFKDEKDSILDISHNALPYFYEETTERKNNSNINKWIYEPFIVEYSAKDGVLKSDNVDRFSSVIEQVLNPNFENNSEWVVFFSTDVRNMTMRAAIIPETQENHLIEASYSYRRIGEPDSCKGLLAYVLSQLPSNYKIWKMTNRVRMSSIYSEKGSTSFILEDSNADTELTQKIFHYIKNNVMPKHLINIKIDHIEVKPFSKARIISRIKNEDNKRTKYDVFLSYSSTDVTIAKKIQQKLIEQGIMCFFAEKELMGGDRFSDEIRTALIESSEVCILFSTSAKESTWVTTEWGAAWALNKKIVPILYRTSPKDLPERLKELQCKDIDELEDYINELIGRQEKNIK
jgi:hypothetical protein